jgi:hypothetical protein
MSENYRRLPVVTPSGKKLILVLEDVVGDASMEEDGQYIRETISVDSIVAVEECPDDVIPTTAMGWDPRNGLPGSQASLPSSDRQ